MWQICSFNFQYSSLVRLRIDDYTQPTVIKYMRSDLHQALISRPAMHSILFRKLDGARFNYERLIEPHNFIFCHYCQDLGNLNLRILIFNFFFLL